MARFSRKNEASTLAEVLIGMVVLTLVVLAVLGILIQSSYLEQNDTEQTEALALAQARRIPIKFLVFCRASHVSS